MVTRGYYGATQLVAHNYNFLLVFTLHNNMELVSSCYRTVNFEEVDIVLCGVLHDDTYSVVTCGTSLTVYQKEVPLLLHDIGSLLIQLVLGMPLSMSKCKYFSVFCRKYFRLNSMWLIFLHIL